MRTDSKPTDPRALRDIANSPEVQDETRELAKDIQRDARRLAPKKTGNLRRNIKVESFTDARTGIDSFAVGWTDDAFYGPFLEEGGEGRAPRPHLAPAAIRNGARGPGGDR